MDARQTEAWLAAKPKRKSDRIVDFAIVQTVSCSLFDVETNELFSRFQGDCLDSDFKVSVSLINVRPLSNSTDE